MEDTLSSLKRNDEPGFNAATKLLRKIRHSALSGDLAVAEDDCFFCRSSDLASKNHPVVTVIHDMLKTEAHPDESLIGYCGIDDGFDRPTGLARPFILVVGLKGFPHEGSLPDGVKPSEIAGTLLYLDLVNRNRGKLRLFSVENK
ncbi:MAG: hypothetical protein AAF916_06410 [Planctomycetota bacterium]